MKRTMLFSSATIAVSLGFNAISLLQAGELPGDSASNRQLAWPTYVASQDAPKPWYEKLSDEPRFHWIEGSSNDNLAGVRTPPVTDESPRNTNSLGAGALTPISDVFSFTRQQSEPSVREAQPSVHAFDTIIQTHPIEDLSEAWDAGPGARDSSSADAEVIDGGIYAGDAYSSSGYGSSTYIAPTYKDSAIKSAGHRFNGSGGCPTLWQAAVDFYYLKRTDTSPVTVLVDDTTRTIEEFNAQSLDFGYDMGYGARLSRALGCGASLNIGYFGVFDQQTAIERTGDLALVVPGFPTGGNPASYNSDYQSQLHSAEINLRQACLGRFGLLAGIRYINLQEDLLLSSQLGAIVTLDHYDIDVDNNLIGAQLGTDVCIARWRSLQIDALVKCGFYLNSASQTTRSSLIGVPTTASNDSFAVAGEAGIYGTYCINDRWSVRAGYQVFGLHGVALAPEQLQSTNLATGLAGIDTTGSAFYGGATFSVGYTW